MTDDDKLEIDRQQRRDYYREHRERILELQRTRREKLKKQKQSPDRVDMAEAMRCAGFGRTGKPRGRGKLRGSFAVDLGARPYLGDCRLEVRK